MELKKIFLNDKNFLIDLLSYNLQKIIRIGLLKQVVLRIFLADKSIVTKVISGEWRSAKNILRL